MAPRKRKAAKTDRDVQAVPSEAKKMRGKQKQSIPTTETPKSDVQVAPSVAKKMRGKQMKSIPTTESSNSDVPVAGRPKRKLAINGDKGSGDVTKATATAAVSSTSSSTTISRPRRTNKRENEPEPVVETVKNGTRTIKKLKIVREKRHSRGSGDVFTCGQNDVGQLGIGDEFTDRSRPILVKIDNIMKPEDISAGGMHTVCLTGDGRVFTFGCNDEGALGRDTTTVEGSEYLPGEVNIERDSPVVQVSAGDSHTAALTADGKVYVWGNFRDASGAMGLVEGGRKVDRPLRLVVSDEVVKISSGSDHLVMLTAHGKVMTMGIAEQGQLGRIAERFSSRDGRKGIDAMLTPMPIHWTKAQYGKLVFDNIWTSTHATFARVKDTNEIFATGLNNYNQLGVTGGERIFFGRPIASFAGKKWTQIAGDVHHTVACDETGLVHVLGRKEYGRLGLGENTPDVSVPTVVPMLSTLKCVDIACGTSTSYAVTSDGDAYAWGMGSSQQLANGDDEDRWQPTKIKGKAIEGHKIIAVQAGAQHVVLLAHHFLKNSNTL